ncbi:hypothetical protein WJX81_004484 [Elliptochloris bilobata]|uniref:Uncharacterized protein n=1 Tax=Elliptochloris bilobata TaxID=381761 RepID=A0AAW1S8U1_9CHLO
MPRSKASKGVSLKEISKLLGTAAAFADGNDDFAHDDAGGPSFGAREGGFCQCARCLRKAGPLTEDNGAIVEDLVAFFEDVGEGAVALEAPGGPLDIGAGDGERFADLRALAEAIARAVERGDAPTLRRILEAIQDEDTQADLASMLAIPVAQHGHAALVHLLDAFGADLEEVDDVRGGPPLMHAANNGHSAAVNALVACGADPEATDFNGQTALMVAVFSDRAGAAESLLEGGAAVDTLDSKGRAALHHAARYGSLDCLAVLAQHHAHAFRPDADGRTPLDVAEDCARTEAAALLRKLQARQRLRERREEKRREASAAAAPDPALLRAREAAASAAEAELLREEAEEAARRSAAEAERARRAEAEREQKRAAAAAKRARAQEKKRGKGKEAGSSPAHPALANGSAHAHGQLVVDVRAMAERCGAAGISVKYGKKMLGKLERACAARAALQAALAGGGRRGRGALEEVLEAARSVRGLLDAALLADAEALAEALAGQEAAAVQAHTMHLRQQQQLDALRHLAFGGGLWGAAPSAGAHADPGWLPTLRSDGGSGGGGGGGGSGDLGVGAS